MTWAETRRGLREDVHDAFAITAWYSPPSGVSRRQVSVRLHSRQAVIGDLDREGYSRTVETVERIIFLVSEAARYEVTRGGTVLFDDGREYRLEVRGEVDLDNFTVPYEVVQLK